MVGEFHQTQERFGIMAEGDEKYAAKRENVSKN